MLDFFKGTAAQRVVLRLPARHGRFHRDEPLLSRAEDYRIVAAPAMRIRVLGLLRMQQSAAALQQVHNRLIRFPYALAVVFRQPVAQNPFFVDIAGGVEPVLNAGNEVLRAMRRRGVDYAGPGVHGHVIGQHAENFAVEERMLEVQALHLPSREVGEFMRIRKIAFLRNIFRKLRRHNVNFAPGFERDILFLWMKGYSHRSRQGPGRGSPDDGGNFLSRQGCIDLCWVVEQRIFHPHRRAGVVFVLHLGLGERGLVAHAPIHGTQTLVDEAVFVKREKSRKHHRLVLRVHRGIGPVEAAKDADPFELLPLQVEKLLRIPAALRAHVGRAHLQLFPAQFLIDLDLNREAVAIPPRHVGRIKARHGLRFDDEILEALVQRRAHVDRAAGVGRAIVQNIGR